jgi:hypothetical protein
MLPQAQPADQSSDVTLAVLALDISAQQPHRIKLVAAAELHPLTNDLPDTIAVMERHRG